MPHEACIILGSSFSKTAYTQVNQNHYLTNMWHTARALLKEKSILGLYKWKGRNENLWITSQVMIIRKTTK